MNVQALRNVRLYGQLGARFGRLHRLAVESPAEAMRALRVTVKGFEKYLMESRENGMNFTVFVGTKNVRATELNFAANDDIRIAPVMVGAKRGGILQIILGIVLIVVGVYFDQPWLVNAGFSMLLGGVVQLLSPMPKDKKSKDKKDDEASYAFNGPINTQAQGNPVPVAYGGPMWIGSAVISAGISVTDGIYIPSSVIDTPTLEDTGPSMYYPLQADYVDRTGNNADLIPSGTYEFGGVGFGVPTGSGQAKADAGSGVDGVHEYTILILCNTLNVGGTYHIMAKHETNSLFGFYTWVIGHYADQAFIGVDNVGGGGIVLNGPILNPEGETCVLGIRQRTGTLDIVYNGAVFASVSHGGGMFNYGADLVVAQAVTGSVGQLIGWKRALSDTELGDVSAMMNAEYIPWEPAEWDGTHGGDNWQQGN